ncbi:cytochrome P450 4V2 [Trichonephila clavata]|uniref:Cytochrome P450 4V2 n=1 Tax=Trichonephila clavata TaxID=2740835 RepID=A0A8X6G6Z8_TRICU|nr:cytochrome P450 4V2 [Trichonephila clavata]
MVPLFFVALVLGFLVLIKYSLWRDHFSRQFPGMKPGFFNVFGDSASVLMYCVSSNSLPFLYWVMQFLTERTEQFQEQQLFYLWTSYQPHFCFVKAESVKQLLSKGTKALEKNWAYDYLKPLMGTGLVTSSVEKWKPRRKLLTPCFHADVLRGFLPVFNERSRKLVEHLRQETEKEFTNIDIPVTLTALDVVYETMLGTSIGALEKNSAFYITAMNRIVKIWEYVDIIFNLTSGKEEKRQVKVIEDFTKSVIQEKKKQYLSGKKDNEKRKRKAFMDMLLELHFENQELSEEDICEEVNTFVAAPSHRES